ncbi:hypothetical protein EBB07_28900 [Paenibacillaceae bacterium]|nr:hypothetical protein EBB07_28900 [Paenibacillaceae bacterium]
MKKSKFKSEVEMKGVKVYPFYAQTKYTVLFAAKKLIKQTQLSHYSYNVPAVINVYENTDNNWVFVESVNIEIVQKDQYT